MNETNSPPDPDPDDPPAVDTTQWPNHPCDPRAIHDKYPPVGSTLEPCEKLKA